MKKRINSLLMCLLVCATSSSGKSILDGWYVPELTLEKYMQATQSSDARDKERALWFFNGVADASKNKEWCPAGQKALSKDLELMVYGYIRNMKREKRKGKRASAVIIEALSHYVPCKGKTK